MGNQASSPTMESSLPSLSFESLESTFNQVVTGRDPTEPATPLMTRTDFAKQFPNFSSQKIFGQPAFNLFDIELLESIDFSSFFGGLTILLNSKVDTKIDALFRLLDPAGNGVLQEYELLGFVEKTLVHLQQIDPSVHWNEKITFDPSTMGGKDADTPAHNSAPNTPISASTSTPTSLSASQSQTSIFTNVNINGNTANNSDENFNEIPLAFGPLKICTDSQEIVNAGLTAIGKVARSKNNSSNDLTAGRTVNKREFNEFVTHSPQLYFIIMWVLNVSIIQHICMQTRTEFIQQCELQLCPLFPMKETQLIESYTQISNFFYEILLRRLSIVNTIQPGSLLQQDLITMEQHFNLSTNQAGLEAVQGPSVTGNNPNLASSTSRRTSSSRLSFSRQPDGTSLFDDAGRQNALLSLKVNPVNFPYTHHLTDTQINHSTFANPITPSVAPTVVPSAPHPSTPRLGSSFNIGVSPKTFTSNESTTTLSRTSSGLRDSLGNIAIGACSTTGAPLPYNTPQFLQSGQKTPFSIQLSTIQQPSTNPIDFVKQNHPGTVQFCLYFLRIFKLQHLLHRNRLASKVLCHELISTIETQLNASYVDLISKQYIYETQTQLTKNKGYRKQQSDGDINQRLMTILNERKKSNTALINNSNSNVLTNSTTASTTTTTIPKNPSPAITTTSSMSSNKGGKSTPLDLEGLQLLTDDDDDDDFDDDDDSIEDPEMLFGTHSANQKKVQAKKDTEKAKTKQSSPQLGTIASTTVALEADGAEDIQGDVANDNIEDHFITNLISPGHEGLLTEAMIPNFLTQCTRAIQRHYIPSAKGPYAMPYLTRFLKTYIPDALGQLLAAYRYVLSKKIRNQVQIDHQTLLVDIQDYITELLLYKETFKGQLQHQQTTICELEELISNYKSQHEDLSNELLLTKEQNMILKTELTDVISVKDMAIITLRDELQFFSKESQHWSDQISKLNLQIAQLKQEKVQKDVEVAQLRSQKDSTCCSIM